MSIEKSLERIADALEVITSKMGVPPAPAAVQKHVAPKLIPDDAIPGVGDEAPADAGMDNAALRDLAQKYIQVAGEKTGALVSFIKDEVCKKLNPKEPKLLKIPADKIEQAAKAIETFAKKNGITLPIEV